MNSLKLYGHKLASIVKGLPFTVVSKPYSSILLVSDGVNWSLDWDIRALAHISQGLGIPVRFSDNLPFSLPRQSHSTWE